MALVIGVVAPAQGTRVFIGSLSSGHSATAAFGTLDDARDGVPMGIFIRFENTMGEQFDDIDSRVLTGVFFNIDGNPQLFGEGGFVTGYSVEGDERIGGSEGDVIPSFWALREDIGRRPGDETVPDGFGSPRYGISAESYGVFDNSDLLEEGPPIEGLDGGLISSTGTPPGGEREGSDLPVWRGFVDISIFLRPEFFVLYGLDNVNSVTLQFGRSFDEPAIHASIMLPCIADVTTQNAGIGDPNYGVPDGLVTGIDLQFYVNAWIVQDLAIADLTTQNAPVGDPNFGVPDGIVTGADIQYYVNAWFAGCP